jgi:hypothetical protein
MDSKTNIWFGNDQKVGQHFCVLIKGTAGRVNTGETEYTLMNSRPNSGQSNPADEANKSVENVALCELLGKTQQIKNACMKH